VRNAVDKQIRNGCTSEDSIDFARMSLTEDELALDVEGHEARKSMICVVYE